MWAAARRPGLLPYAPQARLGTVVHKLVEYAGGTTFDQSSIGAALRSRWDELITQTEQEMQTSQLERHLVPLQNTIADFEVRRIRAMMFAELVAKNSEGRQEAAGERQNERFEKWLESPSGLIGGSIDEIEKTNRGTIIRDFKSGIITEQDPTSGGIRVKREYEIQLKLYAALYYMNFREWPVDLELVPLNGAPISISFVPEDCMALAELAERTLQTVNETVKNILKENAKLDSLASPAPDHCRYCSYRPACKTYQDIRRQSESENWPRDLWGTVLKVQKLRNGKIGLLLEVEGKQTIIRGLSSVPERHPALQNLQIGDAVAVFNLSGAYAASTYTEGIGTVLFPND